MNDAKEKTASCLAIIEKKPQRPGGCVGIFSQLFDWNRKFAKKKFFSRKLLPPVRLKQASKKFGGDEKQPKLRLIADENSGGFPNAKKNNRDTNVDLEQKHETRAPSLIARLMGLESMPPLQRKKYKKVLESSLGSDKSELIVEKGGNKNELRPQKLQKTSCSEKRSVTRFGSDTLPFKNVLARSKKHHHPKLPVPVKSPRNLSRRNSSKLIGAATRILEPGLQTSRSKCALTYSNTLHHPPILNALIEDSDNFASVVTKEQPSYRNCGHFLDNNLNPKPCLSGEPLIFSPSSNCVGFCSQVSERSKPDQSFYEEIEEPLKVLPPSLKSNLKTQSQNQISRTKGASRSKFNSVPSNNTVSTTVVNERKTFVSSNRNLSENFRRGNSKFEMEKRIYNRLSDIVPPRQKRRPNDIPRQCESPVFMSSTIKKQTYGNNPHATSAKDFGYNVHSISQQCRRSGLVRQHHRTLGNCQEDNNYPAKQKTRVHVVEKRRVQNDSSGCNGNVQKSELSENARTKLEKQIPLSGDALSGDTLSALLEQKLKELTSQRDDTGSNAPKKSTAMILQELISALTSEKPFLQNKLEALSHGETSICKGSCMPNPTTYNSSQENAMKAKLSVDNQPINYEHLSPGSVLEAFSNESCISSSHDDNLGYKMGNESMDCCSYSDPRSFIPDSESSDSANSLIAETDSKKSVIEILDIVSETLCCVNLANYGLNGSKLDQTKEVLLNSELIFQSATHSSPFPQRGFSVKHLLLEIETLAPVLWMKFGSSLGVEDCEEVRRFAFDSIIEYLDLRFKRYLKYGSKVSKKLPPCSNTNMLVFEIVEEVRRWKELSRFVLDELVDMEMSRSLREWTQFESETCETGMQISKWVLQFLLDEMLMDLLYS